MLRTQWNDDEDRALRKVTWMARLVYLQGIRRKMDFETGIAGRVAMITYQSLTEMLDCTEHTTSPDPRPTKRMLQRAFESLERAGLVEWIKPSASVQQRGIVFRCLLADAHQSAQKQAVPKRYPSGTQQAVPSEASIHAGLFDGSGTQPSTESYGVAVPPQKSGIQEEENMCAGAHSPQPRAARFDEFWNAWPKYQRKKDKKKTRDVWQRKQLDSKADIIIANVRERAERDPNWLDGFDPMPTTYLNGEQWDEEIPERRKVNGHDHSGQQPANPPTPARRRRLSDAA